MLEDDVRSELVQAIKEAGAANGRTTYLSLPHRLYVTDKQSKLFEDATAYNPGYSANIDVPISELLKAHSKDILSTIGDMANFIDLGPGYPSKSLGLVDQLRGQGVSLTYYAVDVSPYFLDRAVTAAIHRNMQAIGIRRRFEDLEPILDSNLAPPVVTRVIFLGLTFNNFPPDVIVRILSGITRPGDICLICHQPADGVSEGDLLKPYLGEKVRAFAFEPLRIAGFDIEDAEYVPCLRKSVIETRFILKNEKPWHGEVIPAGTEFITAQSYRLPSAEVRDAIEKEMVITAEYIDEVSKIVLMKLTGQP